MTSLCLFGMAVDERVGQLGAVVGGSLVRKLSRFLQLFVQLATRRVFQN